MFTDDVSFVSAPYIVCSGWVDMENVRHARPDSQVIFTEHGCGMIHLDNTGRVATPFAGSWERQNVCLFLCPNQFVYDANRATHPDVPAVIVGDPKLDSYSWVSEPYRNSPPIVAFAFHWDSPDPPGTTTALSHYRRALYGITDEFRCVMHGHPRADLRNNILAVELGMPHEPSSYEILKHADLLVSDTSSFIYEFAATNKPVLLLDCPAYQSLPDVSIRFWKAIPGLRVNDPENLREGIRDALVDDPRVAHQRKLAVDQVYPFRGEAVKRSVAAIIDFVMGDE